MSLDADKRLEVSTDAHWEQIIHDHLVGRASTDDMAALSQVIENSQAVRELYLQMAHVHACLASDTLMDEDLTRETVQGEPTRLQPRLHAERRGETRLWPWSLVALAASVLIGLVVLRPQGSPSIATVSKTMGSLRWTTDGGLMVANLEPGQRLRGGTLETLAADSDTTLDLDNGVRVRLAGLSKLTITNASGTQNAGKLYFFHGRMSVEATPASHREHYLIETPFGVVETASGKLDVLADAQTMKVTSHEGKVYVQGLSSGVVRQVSAGQFVRASLETGEVSPVHEVRQATHAWKADLERDAQQGNWVPATKLWRDRLLGAVNRGDMTREQARRTFASLATDSKGAGGTLFAVPSRRGGGAPHQINYLLAMKVSQGEAGPIQLTDRSRFRVQGRVEVPSTIMFGFSAVGGLGRSGNRFVARTQTEGRFDLEFTLNDFVVMGDRAPSNAIELAVGREFVQCWCLTSSKEANLQITEVELLSPE